jgi:N utilization substance protein B
MQVLYSWEMNKDLPLSFLEGQLKTHTTKSITLYLTNLSYLVEICRYSMVDKAKRLAKYIKTEEDTNSSTIIAANRIVQHLMTLPKFNLLCEKDGVKNYMDDEVVRKLFIELSAKPKYKEYAALTAPTLEQDREIVIFILKKIMQGNADLEAHLEEQFINYSDDTSLLLHIISKYTETFDGTNPEHYFAGLGLWEEEKQFGFELLKQTHNHNDELIAYIEPNLVNWELDRIATLDMILMKMALCELKYFPTVPIKVSINEYIDISKLYSTPKSKDFVNGVLDRIKNKMVEDGEIKKMGRGLVE